MQRLSPKGIQPALTDGYILTTDFGVAGWSPAPVGVIYIDDLLDVDTTTVAPAVGDTLVWDGTNWTPAVRDVPETTILVPLTTVVDGEPMLVWDDDNSLVMTEVPL